MKVTIAYKHPRVDGQPGYVLEKHTNCASIEWDNDTFVRFHFKDGAEFLIAKSAVLHVMTEPESE